MYHRKSLAWTAKEAELEQLAMHSHLCVDRVQLPSEDVALSATLRRGVHKQGWGGDHT